MYTTSEPKEIGAILFKKSDIDQEAPFFNRISNQVSLGFVEQTWAGYSMGAGSQPDEAEDGTPSPTFKTKTRYSNVAQIFANSTELTFSQLGNQMISISGDAATVGQFVGGSIQPNDELGFQVNVLRDQMRRDLDYTSLRGVYNRPSDATASNRKTRGVLSFVETYASSDNVLDNGATGARALTVALIEAAEEARRQGGGGPGVIVVHPVQVKKLNDLYKSYASLQNNWIPADRGVGGRRLATIITPWGDPMSILPARHMPTDQLLIADMAQCSMWVKPVPGMGGMFLWQVPRGKRTKCVELYVEVGFKWGNPDCYALVQDLLT